MKVASALCTRHESTRCSTCKEGLQEGAVLVLPFQQLLRLCQVVCNLRPSGHARVCWTNMLWNCSSGQHAAHLIRLTR